MLVSFFVKKEFRDTTGALMFSRALSACLNLSCCFSMGNSCWKSYDYDIDEELDYSGTNICVIKNKENLEKIISESTNTNKMVVMNFNATWCEPCIAASRFYIESSKKYPYFLFVAVDIDDLDELASAYGVDATPTFFFLLGGTTIDTLVGAHKEQFEKKMEILARFYQ
ncbi:Thioredoxin-like protein [Rhynchospora pubera]|uniref:Thioredoxin-like protein n=1 Tax=Rhynchospora pubera TaxID=906938 RepID=A0AAV8FYV0_9POAL|nr:Thioredoxin-like protein [Rhynchospora pubera]KAJ4795993.1 Thioredoxin-like protein [Rhynchospora pubera]